MASAALIEFSVLNGVVVPALHAYSHSASVGSLYPFALLFHETLFPSITYAGVRPSASLLLLQYVTASSHEIFSTGRLSQENVEGLLPHISIYSFCVSSYALI